MDVVYGFVAGLLVALFVYVERNTMIARLRDRLEGLETAARVRDGR